MRYEGVLSCTLPGLEVIDGIVQNTKHGKKYNLIYKIEIEKFLDIIELKTEKQPYNSPLFQLGKVITDFYLLTALLPIGSLIFIIKHFKTFKDKRHKI